MAYSPQQIFDSLIGQGATTQQATTLTGIAGAESGFGASTVSPVNNNGTTDFGVFQINSGAWPQYGGSAVNNLSLDQQSAAALNIYNTQGPTAWSTYNNGSYQNFLGSVNASGTTSSTAASATSAEDMGGVGEDGGATSVEDMGGVGETASGVPSSALSSASGTPLSNTDYNAQSGKDTTAITTAASTDEQQGESWLGSWITALTKYTSSTFVMIVLIVIGAIVLAMGLGLFKARDVGSTIIEHL